MTIDIVKLENGNVEIIDNLTGNFIKSLSPDISDIECTTNGYVRIVKKNGSSEYFNPSDVVSTQVLPSASIPFIGDCKALSEILSQSFFFEIAGISTDSVILSSTQWSKNILPTTLNSGQIANGFTFFSDLTDKVPNGTTSYNELFISFTRVLTLTGSSGDAIINIDGFTYLITFNADLTQTALDFVLNEGSAIFTNHGIRTAAINDTIKFGYENVTILDAITITNFTPDLSGTFNTSIGDHVVIPYTTEPYSGLRLHHSFRVNFGIATGSVQTLGLSLRRWTDDSIIGSEIPVQRNQDVSGVQQTFISYTSNDTDPFVTGGFYFALRNDSGANVDIESNIGILIQTTFQKPVDFT